jgi:hypothetical protein
LEGDVAIDHPMTDLMRSVILLSRACSREGGRGALDAAFGKPHASTKANVLVGAGHALP